MLKWFTPRAIIPGLFSELSGWITEVTIRTQLTIISDVPFRTTGTFYTTADQYALLDWWKQEFKKFWSIYNPGLVEEKGNFCSNCLNDGDRCWSSLFTLLNINRNLFKYLNGSNVEIVNGWTKENFGESSPFWQYERPITFRIWDIFKQKKRIGIPIRKRQSKWYLDLKIFP